MTNKVKPITPAEARQKQVEQIPDFVFEAFNELIAQKIGDHKSVTILLKDAIGLIMKKAPPNTTENMLLASNWLDVEQAYSDAGWRVGFDSPGYGDSYPSQFKFTIVGKY